VSVSPPLHIGIIDSGIDVRMIREYSLTLGRAIHIRLDADERALEIVEYEPADLEAWRQGLAHLGLQDDSGHGTSVASILHDQLGPTRQVVYHIARVLDEGGTSHPLCLVEALRWMVEDVQPHAINMSLGTPDQRMREPLLALARQAQTHGIRLFAAAAAEPTYPAELETVTAVGEPGLPASNLDTVIRDPDIRLYRQGTWVRQPTLASFACPLVLARELALSAALPVKG
jgi:hypothetical protein